MELVDEDLGAPAYLWGATASSSRASPAGSPSGKQYWEVGRKVPGAFRARVVFLRRPNPLGTPPEPLTDANGTLDADTPLLDSPVFDDLTFVYAPSGDARILAREDGR